MMFVNHNFRSIFKCGELNITLKGLIVNHSDFANRILGGNTTYQIPLAKVSMLMNES